MNYLDEQYKYLKQFRAVVKQYLSKWNLDNMDMVLYYSDYQRVFGDEGIVDFIACVKYFENCKDIEDFQISGCLAHDLNGINKNCFLPKSEGYAKALKKHYPDVKLEI